MIETKNDSMELELKGKVIHQKYVIEEEQEDEESEEEEPEEES